uniref:Uncharacterized protein n=2 Tax=Avena sativa TaxID=4498 RepID=A0ACD5TS43_AVESA
MTRRSGGTSPAAAASLPDDDDMLREILIRLPPRPSSLPRVSAVCRRWRGIVTDAKFLRSFRVHHRKPPLLGVFQNINGGIVFTPLLDRPDRIHPQRFDFGRYSRSRSCALLDCRHGRVLLEDLDQHELVVCDPITGEQRHIAIPPEIKRGYFEGVVLCAACDHGHVHGGRHSCSYKVVLLSTAGGDNQCLVLCVYSLETGEWGNLISTEAPHEDFYFYADVPATLVGHCLYWSRGDHILEFDLGSQNLAVIMGPPVIDDIYDENLLIIHAMDGAVGIAVLSEPHLQMWQRNVNVHGVSTWAPWKTIEMHTILGLPSQVEAQVGGSKFIRGYEYDEDTGIIFLQVDNSVYMVQLKSTESTQLYDTLGACDHHPFRSFYPPGTTIRGCDEADMLHDS